ncbi:hypothetical protein TNCV_1603191 [Trichonephila clavipes]|nr:hypothetical protein TNCV_1603191 [Trichonephila clavipes]
MGDVVGLPLASCSQGCGFDPGPSSWRIMLQINRQWPCRLLGGEEIVAYPHRPMTLHSLTKNSITVLNHKILEANSRLTSCVKLWHLLLLKDV